MKTTFIIDRSIWRCGEFGEFSRGFGRTALYNGWFQCCLGQISMQLGLKEFELNGVFYPENLPAKDQERIFGILLCESEKDNSRYVHTEFAEKAFQLNDNTELNDTQRERALERLAEEYGLRIEFVGEYVIID